MTTSTDIKEPMTTGTSNVYVNYTILEVNYQAGPYKDVAEAFERRTSRAMRVSAGSISSQAATRPGP